MVEAQRGSQFDVIDLALQLGAEAKHLAEQLLGEAVHESVLESVVLLAPAHPLNAGEQLEQRPCGQAADVDGGATGITLLP